MKLQYTFKNLERICHYKGQSKATQYTLFSFSVLYRLYFFLSFSVSLPESKKKRKLGWKYVDGCSLWIEEHSHALGKLLRKHLDRTEVVSWVVHSNEGKGDFDLAWSTFLLPGGYLRVQGKGEWVLNTVPFWSYGGCQLLAKCAFLLRPKIFLGAPM